jgi:hypothetical protein
MMEQTYRPNEPDGHGSLREPFETAEATRSLLSDTDSLFGVLVAQQGRFGYDGISLRFEDREAARTYEALRRDILATIASWRDSALARDLVTMPRLLRAFGGATPPAVHR